MKLHLGHALLTAAAARKAPKKFESAKEMTLDAPAREAKGDQLFCVAPPDEAPLKLVFASITWDIGFKPDSRGRARAVSDDDFHPRRHEVDAPVRRRRIVTQRVQGARGAVRHVLGTDRALRADALLEDDRQEDVLPRGEDGVSPLLGVES